MIWRGRDDGGLEPSESSHRPSVASSWWRSHRSVATSSRWWSHGSESPVALLAHFVACLLSAEEVQPIAGMEHNVAVDGVILCISAAHGVDGPCQVALLVEDVVELDAECQRITTEHRLRYLGIPQQLVGVERGIAVATAALLVEVG